MALRPFPLCRSGFSQFVWVSCCFWRYRLHDETPACRPAEHGDNGLAPDLWTWYRLPCCENVHWICPLRLHYPEPQSPQKNGHFTLFLVSIVLPLESPTDLFLCKRPNLSFLKSWGNLDPKSVYRVFFCMLFRHLIFCGLSCWKKMSIMSRFDIDAGLGSNVVLRLYWMENGRFRRGRLVLKVPFGYVGQFGVRENPDELQKSSIFECPKCYV